MRVKTSLYYFSISVLEVDPSWMYVNENMLMSCESQANKASAGVHYGSLSIHIICWNPKFIYLLLFYYYFGEDFNLKGIVQKLVEGLNSHTPLPTHSHKPLRQLLVIIPTNLRYNMCKILLHYCFTYLLCLYVLRYIPESQAVIFYR